ncbi:MAG: hypothetical protein JNJ59_18905 [Deltaproteobacteria bacterium]|nr:hypothetical protein [Deltaproteobacteria bacterium]
MFPLPSLPLVPKLHRFLEPEQAKTLALVFGIALLVQAFLPWGWTFINIGAGTIWPLIVGAGFVALSFVPGLADQLKPNLFFLIVAGSGALGVLWSFAGSGLPIPVPLGAFYTGGFGLIGVATAITGLFLWARNGYQQLYWTLVLSGLAGLFFALVIPMGGGFPLANIFTQIGGGGMLTVSGIFGCVLSLGYIGLIVLLVLNVFLKKEEADREQVERHGNVLFVATLLFPVVQGLISLKLAPFFLHVMIISGCFLYLTIWGLVCFFEAKARGENLLQL